MLTADPTEPLPDLADLLRFYAEAGVDEPLLEEAVDRFAEQAAARSAAVAAFTKPASNATPTAAAARTTSAPVLPDEEQVARARELAASAQSLEELRNLLASFDGCNLKLTAKSLVFADGNPQPDIMLVGEAPGRDEDIEGLPFAGKSGRLLDAMLAAIGASRTTNAYIANVVPWRPPGNRNPTPLETEICRPFIERQIELARPKILIALGGPSAKVLLNANEGILRLRGNWKVHKTASGIDIPAMPTLHPAYLLRNPAHKKLAWRDLLDVANKLDELKAGANE
ncbi:uracil-DNA glycosylase [Aquamicrobium zhengzhouense]|uniref:Type-4 uracil-DNA glycosylase n=1 Tax=Aquamicrobium zhengzhouense TaxID=2781738 RepID=A0ABS0SBQ7_9HYPH|nr:uracil-DNA glycosylase [Aquamicrobium zhengzhouense]MBI1620730.1 uracil-DNA glycosylase [Aquamicrobium zhengzhouense]